MIRHTPYGHDDPYKRSVRERFPRDPEPGDAVQIGFETSADAAEAWVDLAGPEPTTTLAALKLGPTTWLCWLPATGHGAWQYTIRVRDRDGAEHLATFAMPIGRWRRSTLLRDVEVEAHQATLILGDDGGASARLELTCPAEGVLRGRFAPGFGGELARDGTARGGERDGDMVAGQRAPETQVGPAYDDGGYARRLERTRHAVSVERSAGSTLVSAPGVALRIEDVTLDAELFRGPGARPGGSAGTGANNQAGDVPSNASGVGAARTGRVRTSARIEWLELPDGSTQRFRFAFDLTEREELYGLGERFVGPGLRGRMWDVRVYEEYKEQGPRTYIPIPFVVSSEAWGMWVDADAPSRLDAREPRVAFEVDAPPGDASGLAVYWIAADAPYGVTAAFTRLTGPIALPPTWAYGPWMSANTWNSQEEAEAQIERTLREDVPATVLVLEAWSDESTFYIFNDAEYDAVPGHDRLRLDDFRFGGRWPDPKGLVDRCHEHGIRVLLWQIPVQKRLAEPHPQHDADEAHMLERGYMIRNGDGSPYRNVGWWFTDALVLDVTNPHACAWWFDKRRYLFDELGIDGMKTDGGEHLWGRDLMAHDGTRGVELVNRFAQAYVDAYHRFVRERTGGDGLTFSRAGYTGAHRSPAHWAGDENSTWSAFRASIQAGLSAGLAGISIWGWDIGGFSGEIPGVDLYVRSAQMACFCPVMQFHSELHAASEGRDRTPWNIAERTNDPRALRIYRAYAKLRMQLLDWLQGEAEALAAEGQPLMRYPGLVWPEERRELMTDPSTYLFGRDLLVAPVLEKGATAREVVLPPGSWLDLWSGVRFDGGRTILVPAPLERIPVFVRGDSPRRDALLAAAQTFEAS